MPENPLPPELEALDREWAEERKQYMIRGRFGNRSVPRTWRGCSLILGCGFFIGLAALFLLLPGKMPELHRYIYFAISAIVALAYAGFVWLEFSLKSKYEAAEADYQKRRERIEARLKTGEIL